MRIVALLAIVVAIALAPGCKVCGIGACAKEQGRAVTAVAPQPDGSIVVTTCTLTTKGTSASVGNCQQHRLPRP